MSTASAAAQSSFALKISSACTLAVAALMPGPAEAQDGDDGARQTRVTLGSRLMPGFPGARGVTLRPYVDLSHRRGDQQFPFKAPDENPSMAIYNRNRLAFGVVLGFTGERSRDDVGGLDKVGFTIEAGAFARYWLTSHLRLSAEARQGINGHGALIGMIGADYVIRDRDRWLLSLGTRVTVASGRFARTYFGVTPREAAVTGVTAYSPDAGPSAAGAVVGLRRQLSQRWGALGYVKYERLLGSAAASPIVRRFGARDQWSGGMALSYIFGRHRT